MFFFLFSNNSNTSADESDLFAFLHGHTNTGTTYYRSNKYRSDTPMSWSKFYWKLHHTNQYRIRMYNKSTIFTAFSSPLSPTSLCTVYTSLNCGGNFVNINSNGNPSLNGLHRSVRCAIWIELYTQVIKIFIRNK